MSFDIHASYRLVSEAVRQTESVEAGMKRLLTVLCRRPQLSRLTTLKSYDFGFEAQRIESWLAGVLTLEPPQRRIKAYWFGLFNPVRNGNTGADIYVVGADKFNPDDESFEWACDPVYEPRHRYCGSRANEDLFLATKALPPESQATAAYVLQLGFSALAVRRALHTIPRRLLLSGASTRAVAVGFDSGDALLLEPIATAA